MDENLRWALGIVTTIFLAFAGFVTKSLKAIRDSIKDVDNRVDEVKDNYVRRDDFADRLGAIERGMASHNEIMRKEFSELRKDSARQHGLIIEALSQRGQ